MDRRQVIKEQVDTDQVDIEQLERIRKMESYMDEAKAAVGDLAAALDRYEEIRSRYDELVDYYDSGQWRADFEADESGLLPEGLKRGVLSEDAVYDLITEHGELLERMRNILDKE